MGLERHPHLYLLLRESPLIIDHVTSVDTYTYNINTDTHARVLARAENRTMVISYAFDFASEMHFSVASATSRRLADSDVRFLERRTSDVARERAVRHPALDWLLCLVNRNS